MSRLLLFFHGQALAHTIRPLVMARALAARGHSVALAGTGRHASLIAREGFELHDLETIPQGRIDAFVARDDFAYFDRRWIERSVQAERSLMRKIRPAMVIADFRPTAIISTLLEGIDLALVRQAYQQPGYPFRIRRSRTRWLKERAPFILHFLGHIAGLKNRRLVNLMADIPEFHPPPRGGAARNWHYVGPLIDSPPPREKIDCLDSGWDVRKPLIYLTLGSTGLAPDYMGAIVEGFAQTAYRLVVTTAGRWSGGAPAANIRIFEYLPGEWILSRAKALTGVAGSGAIYQALGRGVPVVGAAEQLDHEYHLNRLEALGLGMRISRRALGPAILLKALERVLDGESGYTPRCKAFSGHLARWKGEDEAAAVVERQVRTGRTSRG